ncbi:MAG: nitroreductase family protein [Anaeroplasma sp.]
MNIIDAIKQRHSVRQYLDKPIENDILNELKNEIVECNKESGLHIQLVINESKAFDSFMAHYGKFSGVQNYIVLIGKKDKNLDELCGYYGERLVLKAQQLGLNTCWVAMTYKKVPSAFVMDKGEKLTVVISLGYGKTQGVSHKIKTIEQVSNTSSDTPDWFKNGIELALLAPTAMNQQKFKFIYNNGNVTLKAGVGFYSKVDLGIVKYHFEIGANKKI